MIQPTIKGIATMKIVGQRIDSKYIHQFFPGLKLSIILPSNKKVASSAKMSRDARQTCVVFLSCTSTTSPTSISFFLKNRSFAWLIKNFVCEVYNFNKLSKLSIGRPHARKNSLKLFRKVEREKVWQTSFFLLF